MAQVDGATGSDPGNIKAWKTSWLGLKAGDTAKALGLIGFADRSISITGVFSGCAVTLKGSNDGTNYFTLHDHFGTPISLVAPGLVGVSEITETIRPEIAGGDGATLVDVNLITRKTDT